MNKRPRKVQECNYHFVLQDLNPFKVYINETSNLNCKTKTISLTLSYVTITDSNINPDRPLLDYTFGSETHSLNKTQVYQFILYYSIINAPDLFSRFLKTQFLSVHYIEFRKTTVKTVMQKGFFESKNFDNIKQLTFRESTLNDMNTFAIGLEHRLTMHTFEFVDSSINGYMDFAAIHMTTFYCESLFTFKFKGSKLRRALLNARQPIVVDGRCSTTSRTYFDFEDNDLDILPQLVFRPILAFAREFNYSSIDCCNSQNNWLWSSSDNQTKELKFRKNTNIECTPKGSISGSIWTMGSSLEKSCIDLANHSILTISIVLVLSLAALLALFSCYCIYYVLPRRNNVVMINSRGKHVNSTGSNSSTHAKVKPSKLRNVSSKSTGILEINSTQTEGPHNRVPLMSTVSMCKGSSNGQGKKVSSMPTERSMFVKALEMGAKSPKINSTKSGPLMTRKSSHKITSKSSIKSLRSPRPKSATKSLQMRKSTSKLGPTKSTKSIKTVTVNEKPTRDPKNNQEDDDRMSEAFKKDELNSA